jgi:2,4-dienoyl-CoA reductase-like NADH-dependent reductase (Old Yellow Enzyme family)/thioredoxin reductase
MVFANLFLPIKIRDLEVKNRVVMAPMAPGLFDHEFVTDRVKHFYKARAEGGVGMIITGASSFVRQPNSKPPSALWDSGMYDDKFISGWKELVSEIHEHDVKIGMQLNHVGRQVSAELYGEQPMSSSALPCPVYKTEPRQLSLQEIEKIIDLFVDASRRCKEAGFDFVEIHGAHGYLGTQFLSPYMNKRTDKYGGNVEGRTRFMCEIIQKIKRRVGKGFVVGVRVNGQDNIEGGATLEDAKEIGLILQKAGADFLHVSATVYGGHPPIAPMAEPPGCFVALAEQIKREVSIPVIAVGKIDTPQLAEEIIAKKKADLIAIGRPLLADPEWVKKASTGKPETIRKCIYCNQGCLDRLTYIALDGNLTPITCMLNPEVGKEREFKLVGAPCRKRVVVVGGGPGGLELARVAAERGHEVILFEKENDLGGQFLLACCPPAKRHYKRAIDYWIWKIRDIGVTIRLNCEGTIKSVMEMQPEVVVIATGASPSTPGITGVQRQEVATYDKVLSGEHETGERVLVIGGGATGLDTADFLSSRGKKVQVVEMTSRFAPDMGRVARFDLLRRLASNNVELVTSCRITGIFDKKVEAIQRGENCVLTGFDSVILAVGSRPNDSLVELLRGKVEEIYVIGDASKPRKAIDAIHEGALVGRRI